MKTKEEIIESAKKLKIKDFFFKEEIQNSDPKPKLKKLKKEVVNTLEIIKNNIEEQGYGSWNVSKTVAECWPGLRASVARHYALLGHNIYTGKCIKKDGRKGDIVIML